MLTERLPGNIPLTRDLLKMLEAGDNVVSDTTRVRDVRLPLDAARRAATPRGLEIEKGAGFSQPPDPDTSVGVVEALSGPIRRNSGGA